MLKNCDLQKNDVLLFVEFGENYNTEYEKIVKFLDRQHGKEYGDFFRKKIYSSELFYYDINEEIKQQKKLKKNII